MARDDGMIDLVRFSGGKLFAKSFESALIAGDDQRTGCTAVESMRDANERRCIGLANTSKLLNEVCLNARYARNSLREQSRWFVYHQKPGMFEKNFDHCRY